MGMCCCYNSNRTASLNLDGLVGHIYSRRAVALLNIDAESFDFISSQKVAHQPWCHLVASNERMLNSLQPELLLSVLCFLNKRDVKNVFSTCRKLRALILSTESPWALAHLICHSVEFEYPRNIDVHRCRSEKLASLLRARAASSWNDQQLQQALSLAIQHLVALHGNPVQFERGDIIALLTLVENRSVDTVRLFLSQFTSEHALNRIDAIIALRVLAKAVCRPEVAVPLLQLFQEHGMDMTPHVEPVVMDVFPAPLSYRSSRAHANVKNRSGEPAPYMEGVTWLLRNHGPALPHDAKGRALCRLAGHPHADLVNMLLDMGADVNHSCTLSEYSPLYIAAYTGNTPIMEVLLSRGASAEAMGDSPEILQGAIIGGREAVQFVLQHNLHGPERDPDLLTSAARMGDKDVVELMLDNGWTADGADGSEALNAAVYTGNCEVRHMSSLPGCCLSPSQLHHHRRHHHRPSHNPLLLPAPHDVCLLT